MGKKRKQQLTREEIATLIEEIAERVTNEDYSFDLQVTISAAEQALLELRHVDGLKLLSRIGLLMSTENGTTAMKYEYVRKRVEALIPLDPTADSVALRSLAAEIRTQA